MAEPLEQPTSVTGPKGPRATLLSAGIILLLLLLTGVAYWPLAHNEFIRYDDSLYVVRNPHVNTGLSWENVKWAFGTGTGGNWHPMTWISHMVDVQLFGLKAGAHHLVSLGFHGANTMLLFLLLLRLTGARWRSAAVAALFALHPLHVESVAWASERKDVLSTFFFLLSLGAYARYAQGVKMAKGVTQSREDTETQSTDESKPTDNPSAPASGVHLSRFTFHVSRLASPYALALLLFSLGLMCKSMLVTLPFVLLLLDFWPLRRIRLEDLRGTEEWIPILREKLPFFVVTAVACVVTFMTQQQWGTMSLALPITSRVANAVVSLWKYLAKTLWPADLAVFYPHPDTRYPDSNQWPLGLVLIALALLAGFSVWTVKQRGRRPWLPAGWFWFLGTLVPVLGLVQVGTQGMADRYTYIPLIGLFICVIWAYAEWAAGRPKGRLLSAGLGLVVATACLFGTRRQVAFWRTNAGLFQHALAVTRENAEAEYHVGTYYKDLGKWETALEHFQAAVKANPAFADGYDGVGMALEGMGRTAEAVEQFERVLRLRPGDGLLHNHVGILLYGLGRVREAVPHFEAAVRVDPANVEARYNLGTIWLDNARYGEAVAQFEQVVRRRPQDREALGQLETALLKQGDGTAAEKMFRDLSRLFPTNGAIRYYLGRMLRQNSRTNEANLCFEEALRLDPTLRANVAPFLKPEASPRGGP